MNKAIITNDIDRFLEETKADFVIRKDEIKIDDVNEIKQKAYIADKHSKLIVLAAEKFNIYAQNALLKLIEEPPKGVDFLIVTNSKYTLLDTILSRVFLEKKIFEKSSNIEIKTITNDYILELLTSDLEKKDIKELLYNIVKQKDLNEEQMKIITDAIKMLELNIDKEAIISLVMLSIKGSL